jgi:branched-chain amino acid transport system substrate-binding protein
MSKATKAILWIVGIVVVVLIILSASKGPKESGPIRIGFIGPLSGDAANVGQNAKAAVEIATAQINSAGGVNGRPLEVIYEDGKCNGAAASSAANKLINIDKIPVILGGACSGETMAFIQIAETAKVPVLSYCSSAPALTNAGDYIFRDYPSDTYQGAFAANYLFTKLGKKSVAMLYVKTDWGVGVKEVFEKEYIKLGGKILVNEGFDQATKDVRTLLAKVKSANPDTIYFLGLASESIVALNQAKDLGIKATWFGGDGWDDPKIWSAIGAYGEGVSYLKVSSDLNETFKSDLAKKVGNNDVTICTPAAYDGLKVLASVINKVGTNSEAIKNELYKTVYSGGISSKEIKFDQNGDLASADYSVMKVKNGVAEIVAK